MVLGVTVASRYAEILLLRGKTRQMSFLLVEGSSDSRVYGKFINRKLSNVIWLNGKDNVLELLDRIKRTKVPGVVAIVDADYDRLRGRQRQDTNVCWTSENDLESMIWASEAFFRATENIKLDLETSRLHRELVSKAAVPIGSLRFLSGQNGWGLDFKQIRFASFIDSARITCDDRACCEEVLNKNPQSDLAVGTLLNEISECRNINGMPWSIVNGHDLCKIAHLCSLRLFRSGSTSSDSIFERMAKNYKITEFLPTTTCAELQQWEASGHGFRVFADDAIES